MAVHLGFRIGASPAKLSGKGLTFQNYIGEAVLLQLAIAWGERTERTGRKTVLKTFRKTAFSFRGAIVAAAAFGFLTIPLNAAQAQPDLPLQYAMNACHGLGLQFGDAGWVDCIDYYEAEYNHDHPAPPNNCDGIDHCVY